ncbi:MAG: hypothetical protein ACI9UA_004304, partial [Pseudoalteromonas tetraodonis]
MIALSALVLAKNPAHLLIIYFSLSPYSISPVANSPPSLAFRPSVTTSPSPHLHILATKGHLRAFGKHV